MGKFAKAIFMLVITGISAPLIKAVYDNFTAPVTGSLVVAGVPENQLAIVGAIPWVFPLGVVIYVIIMLSKPDEPKGGYRQ